MSLYRGHPRASRSVPFLSKSTGFGLVQIATKAMLGSDFAAQESPR